MIVTPVSARTEFFLTADYQQTNGMCCDCGRHLDEAGGTLYHVYIEVAGMAVLMCEDCAKALVKQIDQIRRADDEFSMTQSC